MKKTVAMLCALGTISLWAASIADNSYTKWFGGPVGRYDEPTNWEGGVAPHDGMTLLGWLNATADVTLKFPEGGLSENGSLLFGASQNVAERTITFDTLGTWWEKGVTDKYNYAFAFHQATANATAIATQVAVGHNVKTTPLFILSNAVLRAVSAKSTLPSAAADHSFLTLNLDRGLWDFVNSRGVKLGDDSVYFAGDNVLTLGGHNVAQLYLSPESTFNAKTVNVGSNSDARSPDAMYALVALGGTHQITRVLRLGMHGINAGKTNHACLEALGEAKVFAGNQLFIAGHDNCIGHVIVSNKAEVTANNVYAGGFENSNYGKYSYGEINLSDDAVFTANGAVRMGFYNCATGVVHLADSSRFVLTSTSEPLYMGWGANGNDAHPDTVAVVSLDGESRVDIRKGVNMGVGVRAQTEIRVGGEKALFSCGDVVMMPVHATANAKIVLTGKGRFETPSIQGKADLTTGSGTIALADNAVLSAARILGEGALALTADGGTVEFPSTAAENTISNLKSAEIRAGGLTIDAKKEVALNTVFSGAGTLTLTGVGAFTAQGVSTHAETRLADNVHLTLTDGAKLGNKLTLGAGATLTVPAGVTAEIKALSVPGGVAFVRLGVGAKVSVTDALDLAGALTLVMDDATAIGTSYDVLSVPAGAETSTITVLNATTGRTYTPTWTDNSLSVSVTESLGTTCTWQGTDGNWNDPANWSSRKVPTINDDVILISEGTIALSGTTAARTLKLATTDQLTLSGEGTLFLGDALTVNSGAVTLAVPLSLPAECAATLLAGSTTTVSRALMNVAGKTRFEKTGSGALVVSGDNSLLDVDWILEGGLTTFKGPAAFGKDTTSVEGLSLKDNTVRYEGEPASILRPVRTLGQYAVCFDTAGDLTFRDAALSSVDGRNRWLVKTGGGTLTFSFAEGTHELTKSVENTTRPNPNAYSENPQYIWYNKATSVFAPNEHGEIVNRNGLNPLTIVEGKFAVTGAGKSKTTVNAWHAMWIGSSGCFAAVSPELYAADVHLNAHDADLNNNSERRGYRCGIGQSYVEGSALPKVTLVNARWDTREIRTEVFEGADTVYREVAFSLVNSHLYTSSLHTSTNIVQVISSDASSQFEVKQGYRLRAGSVDAKGSTYLMAIGNGTVGLVLGENLDVRFTDNARVVCDLFWGNRASVPRVTPFHAWFDGATLQLSKGGYDFAFSLIENPAQNDVTIGPSGLTLQIPSANEHCVAFPFRGEGRLTKSGAGVAVFTKALDWAAGFSEIQPYHLSTNKDRVYTNETEVAVLENAGGLLIQEGAAVIRGGAAVETYPVEIAVGASLSLNGDAVALGAVTGGGTVSDGTLSATLLSVGKDGVVPTFANVAFGEMLVDCGGDAGPLGTTYKVAHVDGMNALSGSWKAANVEEGRKLSFTLDAHGDVLAKVESTGGMVIIIR